MVFKFHIKFVNMKKFFLFLFIFLRLFSSAQCVPTVVLGSPYYNLVCSDQFLGPLLDGGTVKVKLGSFTGENIHTFSTVALSEEDTYLALYDGAGTLLMSNDDDANCGGCKQSTLVYHSPYGGISNPYLIISKPGCSPLSTSIYLKFNVRNDYNIDPKITSPINFIQCAGTTANFQYKEDSVEDANPWASSDATIIDINSATGHAEFKKPGIVQISLKGKLSCIVVDFYKVVSSSTSSITSN